MASTGDAFLDEQIALVGADRGRLMDVLRAVQTRYGHVSDASASAIAAGLGMHVGDVIDALSFYAFFSRVPAGRFQVRLSRTPISRIHGADAVAHAFCQALGIAMGETSPDGLVTLNWTSDIGMADQEPAALINDVVVTALTPEVVPAILAALRAAVDASTGIPSPGNRVPLPHARVHPNVVQAGPLLSRAARRGDGIRAALLLPPEQVVARIAAARLRGRGGAGFPTALKWRLCRNGPDGERHIICNADEGEPGTFKDRVLLSDFADLVFDGMTIAGYALGAPSGVMYLRAEYAWMLPALHDVLAARRRLGLLGGAICGHDAFGFEIRIQSGAGAYICGEESALIESLEGKRGAPRDRPPFPTEHGYRDRPTAVNNVETLACVARIMENGPETFAALGTRESTGTKLMSLSGDCPHPGLYEVPFGITLNGLLDLAGAPDAGFVQVGGPSGRSVAPKDFGRRLAYEDLSTGGSIMIFGPDRDVLDIVLQFAEFFADESCGWCTPCRVGTALLRDQMAHVAAGRATLRDIGALESLAGTVARTSRCGLGQTAPNPILSTMRNFPERYEARLQAADFVSKIDLIAAQRESAALQGRHPVEELF